MASTIMEQRRFTRYRLQAGFTGITATTEDGRRIDGHAHDLCEGGVQIEIDDTVRDHERLEVEIELPGATVARSPRGLLGVMKKPVELASDLSPWRQASMLEFVAGLAPRPRSGEANPHHLIGLRAAGKTTLGRELAEGLQVAFQDLDDLALTQSGAASVAEVFAQSGNQLETALSKKRLPFGWLHLLPCWRVAGCALVSQRFERPCRQWSLRGVLACRGGRGWLPDANVRTKIVRRLFGAGGLREEVVRTYAERDPIFRDLARHIVEVDVQKSTTACHR